MPPPPQEIAGLIKGLLTIAFWGDAASHRVGDPSHRLEFQGLKMGSFASMVSHILHLGFYLFLLLIVWISDNYPNFIGAMYNLSCLPGHALPDVSDDSFPLGCYKICCFTFENLSKTPLSDWKGGTLEYKQNTQDHTPLKINGGFT